ncbi:MAG: DUF6048 family protein [Cytophagales bacterium]|nr:DUF6048 family protein [Bernardetiaceae bacterium]MDW8210175.1 DUF6048 family protein [Cytophagales bacterium]
MRSTSAKSCFVFLLAILVSWEASAQPTTDSARLALYQRLRAWRKGITFKPYAFRLGTDLSYWLNGVMAAPFGKETLRHNLQYFYANTRRFEITADMAFDKNKWFIVADGGYSSVSRERNQADNLRNFHYRNRGTYWRLGLDYNVLHKIFTDRQQALLIGVRYGRASFEHQVTYYALNKPWGFEGTSTAPLFSETILNQGGYRWLELVTGLRVALWKGLYLGYTLRAKLAGKSIHTQQIFPNQIPGFGTASENVKLSFSYHLYYRLMLTSKR